MEHYNEQDDQDFYDRPIDIPDNLDKEHQKKIRRKLEERMELRRLREELEDYEGELDDDFYWQDDDKS